MRVLSTLIFLRGKPVSIFHQIMYRNAGQRDKQYEKNDHINIFLKCLVVQPCLVGYPMYRRVTDTVKFIQILNEQSDPTVIELLNLGVLDWSCTRSHTFCFDIRAVFLRAVATQFKYRLAYCVFQSYLAPVVSRCFLIEPEITFMTRNAQL